MALAQPSLAIASARRDVLWADSRNSLGVARLLVHEGRPETFVATVCRLAVESACRAALEHSGLSFDGDLDHALGALDAPPGLLDRMETARGTERLAATERAVGWISDYLRGEAPDRSWGF
ncbi:MAG: hypothetical protein AB7O37_08370 [Vicinamibacteria bacterium]